VARGPDVAQPCSTYFSSKDVMNLSTREKIVFVKMFVLNCYIEHLSSASCFFCFTSFVTYKRFRKTALVYVRGLKLSFIRGPHLNKKGALGPH